MNRGQAGPPRALRGPARVAQASRRGLVLVAVLIVVVVLSLAAYQYANWATSEYKASENAVRYSQAKASAQSGIHYVAGLLASELTATTDLLNGNPYDNSQYFQGIVVAPNDEPRYNGRFSILSPRYEDPIGGLTTLMTPGQYYGVTDEASKINLNAIMIADTTGNSLYNMLMQLPNMTDPIANSIVYWLDPTATERSSGADNTYYNGLSPGYNATNGPIASLEELLWVQGVTPQMLFGDDVNRNGIQDASETITDATGMFGRGWSNFLTIYSREPNLDPTGAPRIYLNDTTIDIPTLYTNLSAVIDPDLATFICLCRLYGVTAAPASSSTTGGTTMAGGGGAGAASTATGSLGGVQLTTLAPSGTMGSKNISSIFSLVNATVTVPNTGGGGGAGGGGKGGAGGGGGGNASTVYASPLADTGSIQTLLPALLTSTTTNQATVLLGRINVNTASQTVLGTICSKGLNAASGTGGTTSSTSSTTGTTGGPGMPILSPTQIEMIVTSQPNFVGSQALDPSFQTVTWLITEAQIPPTTMVQLEPYLTAYTQVYSFQVLGYFDGGGPAIRLEAVIDLNPNGGTAATTAGTGTLASYPRILYQREIAELGKGVTTTQPPQ